MTRAETSLEDCRFEPGEQRNALAQRALELDLAPHGARRDGGDLLAQPGEVGDLVDQLLADDRALHVGDEELLAPARAVRHEVDVDGRTGERLLGCHADRPGRVGVLRTDDRFPSLAASEPFEVLDLGRERAGRRHRCGRGSAPRAGPGGEHEDEFEHLRLLAEWNIRPVASHVIPAKAGICPSLP